jgi:carboxylesterase
MIVQEEGRPFLFQRGRTGCLLAHGTTGTPKEMRWLGEHLASKGISVLGCRLFGHATDQSDLLRARWYDWLTSVEDAYHILSGICDQIFISGVSLGGLLSLYFASQFPIAGLIPCSTPYSMPEKLAVVLRPVLPLLSTVWHYFPKGEPDWHDIELHKDHLEYPSYPIRVATELHRLIDAVQKILPNITAPALIIHSLKDATVPYQHAEKIYNSLGSKDKELYWLEKSGHNVTRDSEREKVFVATSDFIQRVSSNVPQS